MTEKLLVGYELGEALVAAGIISDGVRRVVIDCPAKGLVMLYIEEYGSRKILDVISTLKGVEINVKSVEELPEGEVATA